VKFTSAGEICLTVEAEDSRLIFHVRDTGCGLTPEQQAWIALPFAQVDGGLSRRNSGIGLGLPLVRRLTTYVGGEFKLSARPEGGTVVTFSTLWSR
jgi:signal transduction histidine kinase